MSEPIQPQQATQSESAIDPLILQAAMQRIRNEQNLVMAAVAGAAAALLGGCAWPQSRSQLTSRSVGWLSGSDFSSAMRSRSSARASTGASVSLAGCAAGNLLTVVGTIAKQQNIPIMNILEKLDVEIIATLMQATFSPMDVLFYGIAIYEGYRFSFRQITQADLMKIG